jgi:hypothetical protein
MEYSKRKHANDKTSLVQCCSCYKYSHFWDMLGWHFIPQSAGWIAKITLDNVNAQHSVCNASQHREGKHGDQYRYWIRLDKQYGKWTADKIINKCKWVYSYNVDSISRDIDKLLGLMRDKLNKLVDRDNAHKMLEKRLGKRLYNLLFIEYGDSNDLILYIKKWKR